MNFEDIIVYGACDDNGKSLIYTDEPIKKHGMWLGADGEFDQQNLFPKDKPVKLKLVKREEA